MSCFRPLTAYRLDGQSELGWHANDPRAMYTVQVPCGGCIGCRRDRVQGMALRCVHEAKMHDAGLCNFSATLTVDDLHMQEVFPGGSLDYRAFQLFLKRLRKVIAPRSISFLVCGEYGEDFSRPHFHALFFGFRPDDLKPWRKKSGVQYYRSEFVEGLWPFGNVECGLVTPAAAKYVCGYVMKKVNGDAAESHYVRLDERTGLMVPITPEFGMSSKRPGIGARWFERYWRDVFPADFCVLEGKKLPVPHFYDVLLERMNPALYEQVKWDREQRGRLRAADNTPERLAVREAVALSRLLQSAV